MIEVQVSTPVKYSIPGSSKWVDTEEITWKTFYPIKSLCIDEEILDTRPLSELDENVYGKYSSGSAGHTLAWRYVTVEKNKLRESTPN